MIINALNHEVSDAPTPCNSLDKAKYLNEDAAYMFTLLIVVEQFGISKEPGKTVLVVPISRLQGTYQDQIYRF